MLRETKIKLLVAAVLAASTLSPACGGAGGDAARSAPTATQTVSRTEAGTQARPGAAQAHDAHGAHAQPAPAEQVPAFMKTAAELKGLAPTLAPEQFVGKTQMAYRAVGEIPRVVAQLPCYCHCDQGFGHKSLHTCFTNDHAAHCAVCVDEALLAYKLQKEDGLKPDQIREIIVAQYSRAQ
jgi:hypothetical protein